MDLKNWREDIRKITKVNKSYYISIPSILLNEMGIDVKELEEKDVYMYLKYDEKTRSLTIKKSEKGSE